MHANLFDLRAPLTELRDQFAKTAAEIGRTGRQLRSVRFLLGEISEERNYLSSGKPGVGRWERLPDALNFTEDWECFFFFFLSKTEGRPPRTFYDDSL